MSVTTEPTSSVEGAKVVEGSDGLLLEIDGQIVPNYDATMSLFEEGDVVTGLVVRIDNDEVLVDIGYKSEGVIPSNELSIRKNVDPHDEVEMGEEVDALVLTKEDQDGRLIMSKKRARFEKAWRRIEAAAESGEPVEGSVIEVVKGGLIIDLGVRGFLPASLVDIRRVPNLDEYLGTKIECKVIELNRSRNNVVLSRRAVLEEERKEQRQEILDRLQPGMVVEGDDLEHRRLRRLRRPQRHRRPHPHLRALVVARQPPERDPGDRRAPCRSRCSTSTATASASPWVSSRPRRIRGSASSTRTTWATSSRAPSRRSSTFGAFVEILDGVEGLVHISELAPHHVENPREIVSPDDDVKVKILEIDSERRRLSLSVKRVEDQILPSATRAAEGGVAVDAGDLDDLPELGLSDDVFAEGAMPEASAAVEPRRTPVAEATAGAVAEAQAVEDEAEAEPPRPRPAWPTSPSRRRRRRGRARRRAEDEEPSAEMAGPATPSSRVPFVGLTGGLGAGKSTALQALERLGAATLSTDAVVHELYASDEVRNAVVERWGPEVAPEGVVDRPVIARRVFAAPDERAWLEGLLWPLVGDRVASWHAEVSQARSGAGGGRRRDAAAVRSGTRVAL